VAVVAQADLTPVDLAGGEDPASSAAAPPDADAAPAALLGTPEEVTALPGADEHKEYSGEFYPVAHPPPDHARSPADSARGFSLIELLVVIGIIVILLSLLVPSVSRARRNAQAANCANHLREIGLALRSYLNDNADVAFWRGANLNLDGMDWYGYGGRASGNANKGQLNYFNSASRPLNAYVGNQTELFRCPNDDAAPWTLDPAISNWPADSQFDWVGNSYNFNANGYPLRPLPRHDGGLDGVKIAGAVTDASRTLAFYEAGLYWGADWHGGHQANLAFVDGHVEFGPLPSWHGPVRWDP
jgi:prepilin-type N-terminal cleavage/methylation domain-containing protein/prepilin-type processing-associated H-X9-DG protein